MTKDEYTKECKIGKIQKGQEYIIKQLKDVNKQLSLLPCKSDKKSENPIRRLDIVENNITWHRIFAAGMLVVISKLVFWK